MEPGGGAPDRAAEAWRRAALARRRAEAAQDRARHYELLAAGSESGRVARLKAELAALQRRNAECHLSSAQLQEAYARRAAQWRGNAPEPRFMTGVAEACGSRSAVLTVLGADHGQLSFAASDERAERAQEVEYLLEEGPGRDATLDRGPVRAAGSAIPERWPGYGPEVAGLGVAEVLAVPLLVGAECLGALTVFDGLRQGSPRTAELVAETLTRMVLLGPEAEPELYGGAEHQYVVQQAAGMVAVQARCEVADALAMLKARAFAEGARIEAVADAVVRRTLRLGGADAT
ncbi:GAF domain-containing protein [Streptomyces sp. ODS28]|uniref:GAF domain-containing protein n=1 Tax=Streptomyces sp. ODS28 TaxID=3136688 RepID=UPI0031ECBD1A